MDFFTHESRTLRALPQENYQPSVIYDVGASTGFWSDTIALTVPKAEYHLFEPLAEAVSFYQRDLHERLERRPNLHLHAIALSDRSGTAEIFATHDGFGSSLEVRGEIPEVKQRVQVPACTLDAFIEQESLPLPNVMKLDVQGAEKLILSGARRAMANADVLFMETWLKRGYGPNTPLLTEMIDFLTPAGFTLVGLGEQFRDEHHRLYSVDAVYGAACEPRTEHA